MRFWVRGIPRRVDAMAFATVRWSDGTVTGDPALVADVEAYALLMEGQDVGPEEGPWTQTAHLADPLSALWCILACVETLEEVLELGGAIPQRPAIPAGAIG